MCGYCCFGHSFSLPFILLQFMVDLSNRYQVAASYVQLLTVLSAEKLAEKQIAILLNKW